MTIVQLTACGALTGVISLSEGYVAPANAMGWSVVIYTAVVCTAIAFMVQTWSQAHISATKVAVILTMEVVFSAIFALIFTDEKLNFQKFLGGALIVIAMFAIVLKGEEEKVHSTDGN
jgi:drug/metabolite transporter (DMT)-like permease